MEYLVDGVKYTLSYSDLTEQFKEFQNMDDETFMKNLPSAIHFACIVCFLKEVPSYLCLSDRGIIHELAHLLHIPNDNTRPLSEIRELFNRRLLLS